MGYNNGIFSLDMSIPYEYPFKPPKCTFSTPMYHPLIYKDGSPCLDILIDKWSPALNIQRVVLDLREMLIQEPKINWAFQSFANVDASKLYKDDRAAYDRKVREFVKKHNQLPLPPS